MKITALHIMLLTVALTTASATQLGVITGLLQQALQRETEIEHSVHGALETGHTLHRRQLAIVTSDRIGTPRCINETIAAQCTLGVSQRAINIFQGCSRTDLSSSVVAECSRNEFGDYCTLALQDFAAISRVNMQTCATAINNGSCSNECRQQLQTLRDAHGCCLNTLYNDSSSFLYVFPELFSNELWTQCGVEPIGFCNTNPGLTIPSPSGADCNDNAILQIITLLCSDDTYGPVVNQLFENNCPDVAQHSIDICGARNGQRCIFNYQVVLQEANTVNVRCSSSTNICRSSCPSALRSYRDTAGCCLNSLLNNTIVPNPSTNIELWDRCNVDSPGFCPSTLGGNTVHEGVFMLTVVFTMLSVVLIKI